MGVAAIEALLDDQKSIMIGLENGKLANHSELLIGLLTGNFEESGRHRDPPKERDPGDPGPQRPGTHPETETPENRFS